MIHSEAIIRHARRFHYDRMVSVPEVDRNSVDYFKKKLDYELDGTGSISDVGGVEISSLLRNLL